MSKETIVKAVCYLLGAIAAALMILFGITSCTAGRVISTTQSYYQKGDTSVVMTTKTVETYNAKKSLTD